MARFSYTSKRQVFAGAYIIQASEGLIVNTHRSDIHFWRTGRIGSLIVEGDCILGHEAAGIVLQCGEGVKNLKPGILPSAVVPTLVLIAFQVIELL